MTSLLLGILLCYFLDAWFLFLLPLHECLQVAGVLTVAILRKQGSKYAVQKSLQPHRGSKLALK